MIVPSGIATDDTTKQFFADLVNRRSLVSLYDFENRGGVFPGVHRSYKFCLLTLSGSDRPSSEAEFAFFLYRTEQLRDEARRFTLVPDDFALFNPNTRTCPVFRTRRDADIAAKMYQKAGVFWKEARGREPEINPWGVKLSSMFHMSNDSGIFRTRKQLVGDGWKLDGNIFSKGRELYLPLYEAKLFHQYDHRFATFEGVDEKAIVSGNARNMMAGEKADDQAVIIPRYWVPEDQVEKRLDKLENSNVVAEAGLLRRAPTHHQSDRHADDVQNRSTEMLPGVQTRSSPDPQWILPVRKTTNATNERTSIAAFSPRAGMSDRAPLIHLADAETAALLVAGLNSIVLDFVTRTAIGGTDLSHFIIKQLPVLPPDVYLEESQPGITWAEMVIPRVLELTYTAWDLQPFAEDLGYDGPPFPWDEKRRHRLKCELDAIFAHMYQLDRVDLEWILDAPEPSASFPGLKRSEMQQFGEYRTQRYVLRAHAQISSGRPPNLEE